MSEQTKTTRTMEQAFDEWMRRYIEEPERFSREFQSVNTFVREGGTEGSETSYGKSCAEYFRRLMSEPTEQLPGIEPDWSTQAPA